MKSLCKIVIYTLSMSLLGSCAYFQPNTMFKTKRNYKFAELVDSVQKEYVIRENDIINFSLYSNDGFRLVEVAKEFNAGITAGTGSASYEYKIELDGYVKLPVLGRITLKGYTIREAEKLLEKKYSEYYQKPFILLNVKNKRVMVFSGGEAKVIPLENDNTTLLEAIALSGGISENGRSKRIKLIRGDVTNPQVYLFDLYHIEGIKNANLILQANDIIYVEPQPSVARVLLTEITPYLTLVSTTLTIIYLTRRN